MTWIDLHFINIQGRFNCKVDHLYVGFFSITTYYSTTGSLIGLIHRYGTSFRDEFATE